jgi:hypothetical protein
MALLSVFIQWFIAKYIVSNTGESGLFIQPVSGTAVMSNIRLFAPKCVPKNALIWPPSGSLDTTFQSPTQCNYIVNSRQRTHYQNTQGI